MPDLLGIPLIIFAVFAGFFACHAAAYYWWYSQNLASDTHKVKIRIYAWGSACLVLSMGASCALYLGILCLFELPLSTEAAAGFVVGLVSAPALVLFSLKPKGEKLDQTAKRLAKRASDQKDEIAQLWGMIDDLRSELREKSRELKETAAERDELVKELGDAHAELEKARNELKDANSELAKLKEALSRKESPEASSSGGSAKVARKGGMLALVERLLELKATGCKFRKYKSKGREYVKIRKTVARGKREEKSLGPLDDQMKEALKAAGISPG